MKTEWICLPQSALKNVKSSSDLHEKSVANPKDGRKKPPAQIIVAKLILGCFYSYTWAASP